MKSSEKKKVFLLFLDNGLSMDDSLRNAVSFKEDAVEYHRREQRAMRAWRDGGYCYSLTGESLLAAFCDPLTVPPAIVCLLVLFPWAAFLLYFVRGAMKSHDVEKLKLLWVSASLCDVLPSNVCHGTRLRLSDLLARLVARMTPPQQPTLPLLVKLETALRDCSCLLKVDAAFVGRVVRAYDAVSHELRWLALPEVIDRTLDCEMQIAGYPWFLLCEAPFLSALEPLVLLCAPRPALEFRIDAQDVILRLLVHLFECASYYVGVGGCEFVLEAAATLLERRAKTDCLLPLFADVLGSNIIVVGRGVVPFIIEPTVPLELEVSKTIVLFEMEGAKWRVGRLSADAANATPTSAERRQLLSAPTPFSVQLFQKLRLVDTIGETWLTASAVTLDDLYSLVGGNSDQRLNSNVIRGVLRVATHGHSIWCHDPLAIDTSSDRTIENSKSAALASRKACRERGLTRLFVPWINGTKHWTLLCLDLDGNAVYLDSLSRRSLRAGSGQMQFCKWIFGPDWKGEIIQMASPRQEDAYNCGVFMLLNAWHMASNLELPKEYPSCTQMRVSLAKCWLTESALELSILK